MNTTTSPKVRYGYSEMPSGADHSRLTSVTYPSGYVLTYNYASGLDSSISRLSSLSDATGMLESYSYLGPGTVVTRSHPQPGIDLTYVKQGTESVGDAGDEYTGLDRFGRVVDQRWINTTSGTPTDRFQYTYDRDGNVLSRDNLVNSSFDETYTYDGLNQLATFARGTSHTQNFDYDAVGNFDGVTTDGVTQSRTANAQNEITGISGLTTPVYDANGNMTTDQSGKQFVYDAWNRVVAVKDSGGTTLETFGYDGLNRRVTNTVGSTTTDRYYTKDWQVAEEAVGGSTSARYVWSPVYVNDLMLRDDAGGRLWAAQDANWNVTSLIDGSGVVQERYTYEPFGAVTVYDGSYTVRSGGSAYGWVVLFQGGRYDPVTANTNFQRRDENAGTGTWTTMDPKGFKGGDTNLYRYVGNSPYCFTDASGLWRAGIQGHWSFFPGLQVSGDISVGTGGLGLNVGGGFGFGSGILFWGGDGGKPPAGRDVSRVCVLVPLGMAGRVPVGQGEWGEIGPAGIGPVGVNQGGGGIGIGGGFWFDYFAIQVL